MMIQKLQQFIYSKTCDETSPHGTTKSGLIRLVFHRRYKCIEMYSHVTAKVVSHCRFHCICIHIDTDTLLL